MLAGKPRQKLRAVVVLTGHGRYGVECREGQVNHPARPFGRWRPGSCNQRTKRSKSCLALPILPSYVCARALRFGA